MKNYHSAGLVMTFWFRCRDHSSLVDFLERYSHLVKNQLEGNLVFTVHSSYHGKVIFAMNSSYHGKVIFAMNSIYHSKVTFYRE